MFQPPPLPDLNLQLLVTPVMSGLLGVMSVYAWQRYKPGRGKLISKKLIPVYTALVVGLFVLSLLTQPQFRETSQACQDYQLEKTLYASTPDNPKCDREIADSEASYLAAYPLLDNRQLPPVYLGVLSFGAGIVIALWAKGRLGQNRRGVLRPRT
ncbi:MAG: hypothetical protein M3O33_14160 [Cyanobacteriota bacterium]|nr:hypothetical protein [Cyanobacteriota bacterium]